MQSQTNRPLSIRRRWVATLILGIAVGTGAGAGAFAAGTNGGVVLAPNAPTHYVVKRGDTLWGIAKLFLRDPWYWPEIWHSNPQIHNPHLIYPGDTLRLVYVAGKPQLVLQRGGAASTVEQGGVVKLEPRVRSTPLAAAITTIPYETVHAFMTKAVVLSRSQIRRAPYVLAALNDHAAFAQGNTIYARRLRGPAHPGMSFDVVHVGAALRDPGSGKILGYNGIYTGSARLTRLGHPATLVMTRSARETEPGDRLIPSESELPLDFEPRAPSEPVSARILAVTDGVTTIGQYEVVVIDRGARDGLAPGDVLAVYKEGEVVHDDVSKGYLRGVSTFFAPKVHLPNERSGTFMVFKTFPRVSYGLIMEATNIIRVGDRVENP